MKASTVDTAKKRTTRPPKGNGALPSVHEERPRSPRPAGGAAGGGRRRLLGSPAGRLDGPRRQDRRPLQRHRRANQKMAEELARVGQVVGAQGKTRQRMRFDRSARRLGRDAGVAQHADRRPRAADHRRHPRGDRRRAGQPAADRAPRRRRPPARRRVPALGDDRQHDDQAADACSRPKSRASRAKSAPTASSAARRRCRK